MKRFVALFLVLMLSVCLFSACNTEKEPEPPEEPVVKDFGKIFYVAVDGNDENEGTKESPLATFGGAVAKVREYKAANGLPEGGIKVEFAEGNYPLTETVLLTDEDSGEETKPIIYTSTDGESVIFDGGISLDPTDFKPADEAFKKFLKTEDAKNNVLEIDLEAAGAYDLDDPDVYSAGGLPNDYGYRQTLYVNDIIQTVARWPNKNNYAKSQLVSEYENGKTIIKCPEGKASLWTGCKNIRVFGMGLIDWDPHFAWYNEIDVQSETLSISDNYKDKMPYFVFNIPQELDEPGEYYWDVDSQKLYYWPEENFKNAKISFSQMNGYAFDLKNVSYVTFDGICIKNIRSKCFVGENVSHLTFRNCSVKCSGAIAMLMRGHHLIIDRNTFYMLGAEGIGVYGGTLDEQSENIITNNIISNFGQIYICSKGIQTGGYGIRIANNEICNAPHAAMMICSGLTLVEYNYIHDICEDPEILDCGAVYACRNWVWSEGYFRYNRFENCIRNGLYLDDMMPNTEVYGNIFANIGGNALSCGGGRNLRIHDNIFVNTGGISVDCRGVTWYPTSTSYPEGQFWSSWQPNSSYQDQYIWTVKPIDYYLGPFWRYSTPELVNVLEMRTTSECYEIKGISDDILDSPGPPAYADIYNNIGYSNLSSNVSERRNFIFNRNRFVALNNNEDGSSPTSSKMCDAVYRFGSIHDNIEYSVSQTDIFTDPENGNYSLKDDSRVYRDIVGFEKWDYSLIGP